MSSKLIIKIENQSFIEDVVDQLIELQKKYPKNSLIVEAVEEHSNPEIRIYKIK